MSEVESGDGWRSDLISCGKLEDSVDEDAMVTVVWLSESRIVLCGQLTIRIATYMFARERLR